MHKIAKLSSRAWVGFVLWACTAPDVSAVVLTVGSGGTYADLDSALAAAGPGDTIRFLDSATYPTATGPNISSSGYNELTIESAAEQRATLLFTGETGSGHPSHYWGLLGGNNQTIRNINIHFERTTGLASGGTNVTLDGVNFVMSSSNSVNCMESSKDSDISYCTFYGLGPGGGGGNGISLSGSTTVTVSHCSFDHLRTPIYNSNTNAHVDLMDSALGAYHTAGWAGGFILDGAGTTAFEDYNAVYGPNPLVRADDVGDVTSGGHSIDADSLTDVFVGSTTNGDWQVAIPLIAAASDQLAIGAWQTVVISTAEVADVMGLQFVSVDGNLYELYCVTNLVSDTFESTGGLVRGNGGIVTVYDPTGFSTQKTYRVVMSN